MGINLKEAPPGTRDSFPPTKVGRLAVDSRLTYGQWLKKQPVGIQDEILGPGKAAVFRRGEVSFDRFIDRRNMPLTLKQLRKLEGMAA